MDKNTERRVWQRVYGAQPMPTRLTPQQRQNLRRSLDRATANLRFFENQSRDPVYSEAFAHMAAQTAEHCKMMRQILGDRPRQNPGNP